MQYLHLFICKFKNPLNQNCKMLTSYPTKYKSIKVIDAMVLFFLSLVYRPHQRDRAEKRYYVSVFSESTLLRTICKFRDTIEGYEVIFERVPGKVWNSGKESNFHPPYKFYYGAPRSYIIPCNFSARTIRVEAAAEFIRRDIFWLRKTLSRNPWLATIYQAWIENSYELYY